MAFVRLGLFLSAAAFICAFAPAHAEDDVWNYPAPVRTWNLEAGYRVPVERDAGKDSYYRISYLSALVDSKGTALNPTQHFEIDEAKPLSPGGDRSAFELSLQSGAGALGRTLFDMYGLMPIELRGFGNLRGAAYVGADEDGNNVKASVGLESRPFRVPGMSRLGASNWFVLGAMGERSEATDDNAKDSTYGVVTGRLFIGKAFGWRKSARPERVAKIIGDSILDKAPNLETAKALVAELKARPANTLTHPQSSLIDAVGDIEEGANWERYVRETANGIADALTDQQTLSVYFEASGWHAFSQQGGIPRTRGLVTLTADYWPLPTRDDLILRARYEWGYQRSAPDIRLNQFLITLNVQL